METRWLYTTSYDFPKLREESKRTCVIPMGCIEKHGLHDPLGTDIIKATNIAYLASQLETVCVFPDFTFGDTPFGAHLNRPEGSICLDVRTQMLLLEQLCDEIAANGFNKILVLNCHGGNVAWLDTFARNLGVKPHKFVFGYIRVSDLMTPHTMAEYLIQNGSGSIPELTKEDEDLVIKYHNEDMLCGHACMGETAYIMGLSPQSVHLERLGKESGLPQESPIKHITDAGIITDSYDWFRTFPNWYEGHDPVGCNERIGKAAVRMESERIAKAFKVYKEDEAFVNYVKNSYKNPEMFEK